MPELGGRANQIGERQYYITVANSCSTSSSFSNDCNSDDEDEDDDDYDFGGGRGEYGLDIFAGK